MEGVGEVSVVQDYVNREEKAIEVIYYFPVEEGAAVTKVEAEVEGRMIDASGSSDATITVFLVSHN